MEFTPGLPPILQINIFRRVKQEMRSYTSEGNCLHGFEQRLLHMDLAFSHVLGEENTEKEYHEMIVHVPTRSCNCQLYEVGTLVYWRWETSLIFTGLSDIKNWTLAAGFGECDGNSTPPTFANFDMFFAVVLWIESLNMFPSVNLSCLHPEIFIKLRQSLLWSTGSAVLVQYTMGFQVSPHDLSANKIGNGYSSW